MNITAKSVQKICTETKSINYHVNQILRIIQSNILKASKEGMTSIQYSVPVDFNVLGMSNFAAQTIIYYKIIKECEEKGFNVELLMDKRAVKCIYNISWNIERGNEDLENMVTFIKNHKKKKNNSDEKQE